MYESRTLRQKIPAERLRRARNFAQVVAIALPSQLWPDDPIRLTRPQSPLHILRLAISCRDRELASLNWLAGVLRSELLHWICCDGRARNGRVALTQGEKDGTGKSRRVTHHSICEDDRQENAPTLNQQLVLPYSTPMVCRISMRPTNQLVAGSTPRMMIAVMKSRTNAALAPRSCATMISRGRYGPIRRCFRQFCAGAPATTTSRTKSRALEPGRAAPAPRCRSAASHAAHRVPG